MRKLFLTAAFAASLTITYAQDLKDVQEKFSKGKIDEAKEKLEKFMADPKNANNATAFYWKAKINTYYAQNDSAGTLTYDAANEAFNAYKKTLELEPKNVSMTLDQNIGLFQLFDMHYNRGIRSYNNKNYDVAFKAFKNAMDLQDYIKSKNFALSNYAPPALDTQLINLTASSAYLAKQEDASIPYFERLANAKLSAPEFKEVYALLAQHYLNKNNAGNAEKYIGIGKELFKDDEYWLSLEFNNAELRELDKQERELRTKVDNATGAEKTTLQKELDAVHGKQRMAKLNRYEEILQKYPTNKSLAIDYAIEQFNHTYVWDKKPADYTARQAKLQTALDKALAMDSENGLARFIQSQHYYSQVFDLEDARRALVGNAPATAAKRKELNAQIDKKYDEMAEASQKALDIFSAQSELKPQDKSNMRRVTDQLIDYYTRKKMNDKVTFYQNKKAAIK